MSRVVWWFPHYVCNNLFKCLLFFDLGMVYGGVGATHVNAFITSMNIPAVNYKTLDRHQKKVGKLIEKVARDSCV